MIGAIIGDIVGSRFEWPSYSNSDYRPPKDFEFGLLEINDGYICP